MNPQCRTLPGDFSGLDPLALDVPVPPRILHGDQISWLKRGRSTCNRCARYAEVCLICLVGNGLRFTHQVLAGE